MFAPKTTQLPEAPREATSDTRFGSTDLLLLLMTFVWGANFTAIKYSIEDLLPLSFNGLRFAIASVVVLATALATGHNLKVAKGDGWRLFGLGLLANTFYQSVFIIGMSRTRAGNAALILATTPLVTAIIGRFLKQEYFTTGGVFGLMLAFGGILLIILSGHKEVSLRETLLGDCLLVAATLFWSLYTVGSKRLIHKYGSMKSTTIMMTTGTPVLLLVCAPSLFRQDWSRVRPIAWAGLIYSAFLAIALAYIIWNHGVRKIGSTRTAIYSNITPIVAMLVAWPALGEVPSLGQLAGAVVIFIGIYLVRRGMIPIVPDVIEEELDEAGLAPGKN